MISQGIIIPIYIIIMVFPKISGPRRQRLRHGLRGAHGGAEKFMGDFSPEIGDF